VCPRCSRPNVIKETEPMNIRFVFKEQPQHDTSPEEEIKRSKDLLRPRGEKELTVGDLSVVKESKQKRDLKWSLKPVNCASDVTVGDLYEPKKDNRGLNELYEGLKPSDIRSHVSESQRLQWKLIKDWKEKQRKIQEIRELLSQEQ